MESNLFTADRLAPGAAARIQEISLTDPLRRRLLDLGLIPGARICRRFSAPSGSPIAYMVEGTLVALRRADAAKIYVREE